MARYKIAFLKTVCGPRGQERTICQRSVEVESENEIAAIQAAKGLFCARENISDWSFRADAFDVERSGHSHCPPPREGDQQARQLA